MSGAAVERYRAEWVDSIITAWTIDPLPYGNSVELVLASAHDAAIAALTAELQQCRQELREAVPDLEFAVAMIGKTYPDRAEAISLRLVGIRAALKGQG